jgi:hypothetical protein
MALQLRWLLPTGVLFLLAGLPAQPGEKQEMVENPFYKFWASFKEGSTAVHLEKSKVPGADLALLPDATDEKRIAYKLIEVSPKRVVVEMVVTEKEFLGYVQSAPTRQIYPAKVKKAHLEQFLQSTGAKTGEETLKFKDKEVKCKTVAGTIKGSEGEQIEYKLWIAEGVPGSIMKKTRTTRQKGEVIAETTLTLQSYKVAE